MLHNSSFPYNIKAELEMLLSLIFHCTTHNEYANFCFVTCCIGIFPAFLLLPLGIFHFLSF